ncbi:MAG TPA: trypsin-like peptidase domain-containing protein [Actinomycetota bacterium]|jgi:S1-C subfamily serine protease
MKRTILILLVAALGLSACTMQRTNNSAEPQAVFPSGAEAPVGGRNGVVDVVDQVLPAVVNVVAESGQGQGEGTGFIVRSDGIIVTNFHVVEGASRVTVVTSDSDPVEYDARVIGGDIQDDLAVLDVEATDLPTVPLGDSADLRLGQPVVAIGYALGLAGGPSVTTGVVSSLTRNITVPDANCAECEGGQRVYTEVIQTDAAINPGNSGGPLVDLSGRVVGINTAGANEAENIGFAIQIDSAKSDIFQAAENPSAPVAFMGISSGDASDPQIQFELDPPVSEGAAIVSVVPGGPADDAGIQPGDVVVGFDGQDVTTADGLGELIRSKRPGDTVEVDVVHPDGSPETLTVTLGVNPVSTP